MRYTNLFCILMAAVSTTSSTYAQQPVNVQDSIALVDLYDSTNGENWSTKDGWKQGPVNTWYGVVVTDGRITQLYLAENNLNGSIPPSFGNLTSMERLTLYNNQLSSLPETFGNLVNLTWLDLNGNQLTTLPA